jgi:hypothetical protein
MDWYDAGKDLGVGLVGTVLGGLGIAFKLKPKLDRAVEDIQALKEHELVRVQNEIETIKKEVVRKEECDKCNAGICSRIDTLIKLSDRNYGETVEVRKDLRVLISKSTQLF